MPETRYITTYDQNGNIISQVPYEVSDEELALEKLDIGKIELSTDTRIPWTSSEVALLKSIKWNQLTPDRIDTYIDNNVTDLASAKEFLKKLSHVVLLLVQRELSR